MNKTITIFGNGYVSTCLIQTLSRLGWNIYCTSRQVDLEKPVQGGNVKIINFLDPTLPSIIQSSNILLSTVPPDNGIIDPVLQTYSDIISKEKFDWIGYLSSTSVYGDHDGNWVDEKTECAPSNEKSRIRLLAEEQWLDLYTKYKLPIHIFRLSGIYGPNRNCLEQIKNGKDFTIVKKAQYFSRIHVEDICRAIIASINSPTVGEIYNLSDDEPAAINTVQQFGANLLAKNNLKEIAFEDADLSEQVKRFFNDNKKIMNKKIKKSLNFQLDYPNYRIGLTSLFQLKKTEQPMNYLITGGTGFIGSNFLKHFVSKNDSVIILSRKNKESIKNCRFVQDLSLLENDKRIDCIINLAGKAIDCIWTKKNKKNLLHSRLAITKSLVDLVKRLNVKPKIIVSASAVGFYGNYDNQVLDEAANGKKSFTHDLCQQWEDEALKLEKYGVRVCIMRLGVVLGKNDGYIKKISLPFKLGLGGKIASGKQFLPWIHIDDVLLAMKFVIQNNSCSGIYNFVAPETITNEKVTKSIAEVLKKPALLNIPGFLIKIIFGEMGINLLLKGNKIIPKRLKEQGYKFKYDNIKSALNNIFNKDN